MITNVVCALIERDGKYLIAKRSTGNPEVLGKWEFPGGKVEAGETEEAAIEREMREEFEVEVKAIRFVANNVCEYPNRTIDLRLYECKYISGEFKIFDDHSDFKFITKEEFKDYEFCPADIPLVERI